MSIHVYLCTNQNGYPDQCFYSHTCSLIKTITQINVSIPIPAHSSRWLPSSRSPCLHTCSCTHQDDYPAQGLYVSIPVHALIKMITQIKVSMSAHALTKIITQIKVFMSPYLVMHSPKWLPRSRSPWPRAAHSRKWLPRLMSSYPPLCPLIKVPTHIRASMSTYLYIVNVIIQIVDSCVHLPAHSSKWFPRSKAS